MEGLSLRDAPQVVNTADTVFGPRGGSKDGFKMLSQPLGTRRPLRVICIGAGASGINICYQVQTHMKDVEVVAYEKNAAMTGTWFENKYPGCACDIPSHTYAFTWAPYAEWSQYYSTSDDIEIYFNSVVDKHGLRKYFLLRHEVVGARWDEATSHWIVRIQRDGDPSTIFEDWCDFLINGSGMLNKYKWPEIEGLKTFRGPVVHTAAWDPKLEIADKRVALIGVGSSGVQILPQLQPIAKHVTHFIRSKTWITPSFGAKYAGPNATNFDYTEEQKKFYRENPEEHLQYIRNIELEMNKRFKFVIKESDEQKAAFITYRKEMTDTLKGRQDLIDMLVPDFAVGCRRLTPGPGFLAALQQANVSAVSTGIKEINASGLRLADGTQVDVDVIVCATGFDLSFLPRFPIFGKNGKSLADQWSPRAHSYLSMFAPNMPNYAVIMGPGAPAAHGGVLTPIEMITEYVLKVLRRLQTEPIKSVDVKVEAVLDLASQADQQLATTAWSSGCSSSFKNGTVDGSLDSLHCGGRMHFFAVLTSGPRWEDFNYEYSNNRFAHFGNGFTLREIEGRDLTYYWNESSDTRIKLVDY